MKKLYWVILLFPFYLFSQEHFYYYKGERQPLKIDTRYVFVSTTNSTMLQNSNLVQKTLDVYKEQTSAILKQKQNATADFYWAEVPLEQKRIKESYTASVKRIEQIDGV